MSHGLTVPEANQSPYPLQEPPHTHKPEVKGLPPVAKKDRANKRDKADKGEKRLASKSGGALALIGAALGLGALAIGAVLYERQAEPAKKKGGKKSNKR
ncbi:hypothetical protein [uncultured Sphingomonas sp.]|uniref:hypothetical protein n=1 Tax=uncultured Sphingomonas sp. TaxID=158754 RepID=UPI0035CBD97E